MKQDKNPVDNERPCGRPKIFRHRAQRCLQSRASLRGGAAWRDPDSRGRRAKARGGVAPRADAPGEEDK